MPVGDGVGVVEGEFVSPGLDGEAVGACVGSVGTGVGAEVGAAEGAAWKIHHEKNLLIEF